MYKSSESSKDIMCIHFSKRPHIAWGSWLPFGGLLGGLRGGLLGGLRGTAGTGGAFCRSVGASSRVRVARRMAFRNLLMTGGALV